MTNIIASSPNIQGNISNCEIQDIMIKTDQTPLWFKVTETHQVINKCDFSVINEYTASRMNQNYWGIWIILIIVFIFWALSWSMRY